MRTVCIIQARMGSYRLPGKSMMHLAGKPCVQRVVERVRMADKVDEVVVATSSLEQDDVIAHLCETNGYSLYRGSETDVLARYYEAAVHFGGDRVMRVTGDCPLIDPGVLNALVSLHEANPGAFVSNNLERSFPLGLDAEVFSILLLEQATKQTGENYDHEHVSQWMRALPGHVNLRAPVNLSNLRLTLDTRDDLTLIRAIFRAFATKKFVTTADVLWLLKRRSELAKLALS